MRLTEFLPLAPHSANTVLMATVAIPAGEPQDIESELERIDLNEYLTSASDGIYLIRVEGDSMEAEIFHGDLLVVNRNLQPQPGDKVIARVGASYTVKIYSPCKNGLRLIASNEKYPPRFVDKKEDCEIFGVVTHVIHKLKKI
jgi:DNA polymerase V